ncbi:hypothetical protein D3C81_802590 [compost metagenome]
MKLRILSFALPVSVAAALAGCVSQPIYDWRSILDDDVTIQPVVTMDRAILHLNKARKGYGEAVEKQMNTEASASRFLIAGAGVLLTAVGLKASSDVLLVGGATTATAYSMANSQLPRARISAYLAGIDALNCAEASIGAIRATDYRAIKSELALLDQARDALRARMATVQALYEQSKGGASTAADALVNAADTLKGADTVMTSTQSFLAKTDSAAAALHTQVEKIDKSVTQAIVNGTPDISQIKQVTAGLGSNISAIIAKAVTDSNAGKSAPGGGVAAQSTPLADTFKQPVENLLTAQKTVQQHMLKVKALLPANYEAINTQALSDCGLPALLAPFKANPVEVQFFAGKPLTRSIDLSGGKKEYVVEDPVKPLPAGMKLIKPGPSGTTLDIVLDGTASTVPGDYELRLHDQSQATDGSGTAVIKIKVAPGERTTPTAPAPDGNAPSPATPTPQSPQQAILALRKVALAGSSFTILTADVQADKSVAVGICEALDELTRKALGKAIRDAAKVAVPVSVKKERAACT